MANRIVAFFREKKENEKALICYFPVGDPSFDSLHIASLYLDSGTDILEIGIPVEDPYLDGEVVAESMKRALEHQDLSATLEIIVQIRREHPDAILQGMCYKQLFNSISWDKFNDFVIKSGLDGLLVADADFEEQKDIRNNLNEYVSLLSFLPFSYNKGDLNNLNDMGEGYVFLQAIDGATGMRKELDSQLESKIHMVKQEVPNVPVCVGFGISNPEHCRQINNMGADGVIIGSATLNKIAEGDASLVNFVKECKKALV